MRIAGYPFVFADGPRGLTWLAEASACHRAAGDTASAREADRRRKQLSRRLQQDYRLLRLRLEHALVQGRERDAAMEVRALLSLLSGLSPGPYVRWLRRLERRLP